VAVVMLMVFLIIAITTASGLLTNQNYATGSYREKTLHADLAVKAGISTAMAKLTEDPLWSPTQTTPYTEFLDPNQDVGFEIWLDVNNEQGTGTVLTSTGEDLRVGQVAMRVRALVNGEQIASGFGGADQLIIMERPTVQFDNALFKVTEGPMALASNSTTILSYNSDTGIMPFTGLPATPPPGNQSASVRSLDDLTLNSVQLNGEAVLPTHSNLVASVGGSYLSEARVDEAYLPRIFEDKGDLPGNTSSTTIVPGDYNEGNIPSGATVNLVRGGTYYFSNHLRLADNVTLNLTGPATDGPVKIFCHAFFSGQNTKINLPPPGQPPVPGDLQVYGINQPGCASILVQFKSDTEAAMVFACQSMDFKLAMNSKFYGAVNANGFFIGDNVEIHYDEALRGQLFDARTEWVLVSHGIR
jgi:hypothetical protein